MPTLRSPEDTKLMAEGKHLGAELGVGAGADQDEVDDEEDQLVGEAEKHARGKRPAATTIRGRRPLAQLRGLPRAAFRGAQWNGR